MELPALIFLSDHEGVFINYFEAVYSVFVRDFVNTKPSYRSQVLKLKSHPYIDGKEYTFYHLTHDGKIEENRLPNIRRMERIAWPRPMIDNSVDSDLKVWENKRGNKTRILIFHEDESYLVILDKRKKYILLWTAYLVDHPNQKKRLLAEYKQYLKTKTA